MISKKRRETKYTRAVSDTLRALGHATNAEIAASLRIDFPYLSDTTVHRITSRFYDDGMIGMGPKAQDGSFMYDANAAFHDHFVCEGCGVMRDIAIPAAMRRELQAMLQGCCINGSLTLVGDCNKCKEK